jgi:hypothetical protein
MSSTTPAQEGSTGVGGPSWSRVNWAFIGLFTLLTVVGVAISAGVLGTGWLTAGSASQSGVQVPPYVYLYSSLGALGYVFTKLMADLDQFDEWGDLQNLAEMGLRVPAAWVLAAGIHLLLPVSTDGTSAITVQLAAGTAFIVGLYVNVALKSLGSLADRILGRGVR